MTQSSLSKRRKLSIPLRLAFLILPALLPLVVLAVGPAWWTDRGVINTGAPAVDYAAVNQGQLMHIARAGVDEFDQNLPGGAGDALHAHVAAWVAPTAHPSDYSAVNLGEVKALSSLFLNRLIAVGYTNAYPWASSTNANDYAMANIGQVKQLFAWNLVLTGTDGLPAWWKNYWSTHLDPPVTITATATDPVTTLTYLQDFIHRRTPGSAAATGPADAVALEIYTPLR